MRYPTVVLPHPDSPTNPRVSRGWIVRLTESTARRCSTRRPERPPCTGKCFTRSMASMTGCISASRSSLPTVGSASVVHPNTDDRPRGWPGSISYQRRDEPVARIESLRAAGMETGTRQADRRVAERSPE